MTGTQVTALLLGLFIGVAVTQTVWAIAAGIVRRRRDKALAAMGESLANLDKMFAAQVTDMERRLQELDAALRGPVSVRKVER